jgi:hypothetical protein
VSFFLKKIKGVGVEYGFFFVLEVEGSIPFGGEGVRGLGFKDEKGEGFHNF